MLINKTDLEYKCKALASLKDPEKHFSVSFKHVFDAHFKSRLNHKVLHYILFSFA